VNCITNRDTVKRTNLEATSVSISTPDPQETLANISDIVHSTPDPQETLVNICAVNCITNVC
jgi:hypothetical protein